MDVMSQYEFAATIVEWAIVAIPTVLGTGAVAVMGYGVVSTARSWIKEGGELLKLGTSIITGAAVGGFAGAKGVLTAAKAGAYSSKLKLGASLAGRTISESFKGATQAAVGGSRGWLATTRSALWSNDVFHKIMEKRPNEEIIEKTKLPDGTEVQNITQRKQGDTSGATERKTYRTIIDTTPPSDDNDDGGHGKPPPGGGAAQVNKGESEVSDEVKVKETPPRGGNAGEDNWFAHEEKRRG